MGLKRFEPKAGVAARGAETCGDGPVFAFDIDLDQRTRPVKAIRYHDADILARSRGRREDDALLTGEHQISGSALSQDESLVAQESRACDLPGARESRLAVEGPRFRDHEESPER